MILNQVKPKDEPMIHVLVQSLMIFQDKYTHFSIMMHLLKCVVMFINAFIHTKLKTKILHFMNLIFLYQNLISYNYFYTCMSTFY